MSFRRPPALQELHRLRRQMPAPAKTPVVMKRLVPTPPMAPPDRKQYADRRRQGPLQPGMPEHLLSKAALQHSRYLKLVTLLRANHKFMGLQPGRQRPVLVARRQKKRRQKNKQWQPLQAKPKSEYSEHESDMANNCMFGDLLEGVLAAQANEGVATCRLMALIRCVCRDSHGSDSIFRDSQGSDSILSETHLPLPSHVEDCPWPVDVPTTICPPSPGSTCSGCSETDIDWRPNEFLLQDLVQKCITCFGDTMVDGINKSE